MERRSMAGTLEELQRNLYRYEVQDQWADALMAIAQDPQARSALAKLCDAHKQVLTVPGSMACGQRQAYDKWVRKGITAFTKMLQHLAVHTTKAIVGGAVEDLKLSLVVIGVKELIVNLNMQPPVVDPSTLNFVQPEEQIKETLMLPVRSLANCKTVR